MLLLLELRTICYAVPHEVEVGKEQEEYGASGKEKRRGGIIYGPSFSPEPEANDFETAHLIVVDCRTDG